MADKRTDKSYVWTRKKRINRRLPASVKLSFARACILCRKMPRVQGRGTGGPEGFHVSDGVLIPQQDCTFEGRTIDGNHKLVDRWVYGSQIEVLPRKVRGSRNHHKFLVRVTDGMVA